MRHERNAPAFFERAVTIHRLDCRAVAEDGGDNGFEVGEADMETLLPSEEAVRYGLESRPVFDGLRRLTAHLAGLLILVETGGGRRILDLPDLAAARDRLGELTEALAGLKPTERLRPNRERLAEARDLAAAVLRQFEHLGAPRDGEDPCAEAARRLKDLCELLKAASEPRIGLSMVDLRQACCNCQPR